MSEILHNLARDEYDALKRVNYSRLRLMGKSPAHYLHGSHMDSKALKLGNFSHLAVFEPHRLDAYHLWTGSKVAKGWKAFKEEKGEENIITDSEREEALRIRDAIYGNPDAAALLADGKPEVTVLWELAGEGFSFECKARVDWLCGDNSVVELKTCRDASRRGFGKQAAQLGYTGQLGYYGRGVEYATQRAVPNHLVIAVETEAPYPVTVFEVLRADVDAGWGRCCTYLDRLAECQRTGLWPGYAQGRVTLELPAWAVEDFDEETEEEAA